MKFISSLFLLCTFISSTNAMPYDSLKTDTAWKEINRQLIKKKIQIDFDNVDIKDEDLRKLYRQADSALITLQYNGNKDRDAALKYINQRDSIIDLDQEKTGRKFFLIGDAGVVKTINDSGKVPANGSFGLKYISLHRRVNVKVLMVVASSSDPIKAQYDSTKNSDGTYSHFLSNTTDFGTTILTPTFGKRAGKSGSIEVLLYPHLSDDYRVDFRFGFRGSLELASQLWDDTVKKVGVSMVSFEVGIIYDLIPLFFRTNKNFALRFNLSFIERNLWGDIYDEHDFQNKLIGETKKGFWGFKVGAEIELNGVVASMQFPIIINSKLKGLSKGQLVGGFSLSAAVPLTFKD